MHSAMYYPFTGPNQEEFLKKALFLWDTVDFMVPYKDFRLHAPAVNAAAADAALEIIGRGYVPTDEDKQNAHEELEDFCTGPLSDKLVFDVEEPELLYPFYPQKLFSDTWEMLAESRLAKCVANSEGIQDISTSKLFGYYLMSVLAVCCNRGRKALITDAFDPYRALATILTDASDKQLAAHEDPRSKLLSIRLNGPSFIDTTLEQLVSVRTNEDQLVRELRNRFLEALDKAASNISANAGNSNTVREVREEFARNMELDLVELKRALGRSATSILLTKEAGLSVLALTAVPLTPVSGVLAIGGLYKGLTDYKDRRRKILLEHPSSWLLATAGPRMPIC